MSRVDVKVNLFGLAGSTSAFSHESIQSLEQRRAVRAPSGFLLVFIFYNRELRFNKETFEMRGLKCEPQGVFDQSLDTRDLNCEIFSRFEWASSSV